MGTIMVIFHSYVKLPEGSDKKVSMIIPPFEY
jgi:hypothetical protein